MKASMKNTLITDLDETHGKIPISKEKPHLSRIPQGKKTTQRFSQNPTRSKSVELNANNKPTSQDLQDILEGKNKQMESLVQRVILLYKYNNQFAKENKKLHLLLQQANANNREECKTCNQFAEDNEGLVKMNNYLQNDLSMMKVLVYRLNVQIDNYQEKIRFYNEDGIDSAPRIERSAGRESIHRWGPLNTETLSPLLKSYEEIMKEKEDLIHEYENELKYFTGELKKVIDENLKLQEEHDLLKKSSNGWLETKARLHSQLESLKSNLDVQTRRADLAKEKLLEVIQCYEQKTQTLSFDMEHLHNAYTRCKQDLICAKSNANTNPDIAVESLKACKQLFEELKEQHSKEKNALALKSEELVKHNADLLVENEQLKNYQNKLKKELDTERKTFEELKRKIIGLQRISEKLKKSRDRLKTRLKMTMQWTQKLEQERANFESTWESVKKIETIVKHKEAQIKGLQSRYLEEMDKMKKKLQQKEETIKHILKSKVVNN